MWAFSKYAQLMKAVLVPMGAALLAIIAACGSPLALAAPASGESEPRPSSGGLWPEFWIGVAAGAVAAVVFAAATWVLKAAAEKAYREFVRRRAEDQLFDISGIWESDDVPKVDKKTNETYTYKEIADLKQDGENVHGTLNYLELRTGSDPVQKLFTLRGIYRERSLTVYYRTADRRSASTGCIAMQLLGNDRLMEGGCVYYDGEIVHDKYNWKRRE